MDYDKINSAIMDTLTPLITPNTPARADILNDAISKAIIAALKEYDNQKQC